MQNKYISNRKNDDENEIYDRQNKERNGIKSRKPRTFDFSYIAQQ